MRSSVDLSGSDFVLSIFFLTCVVIKAGGTGPAPAVGRNGGGANERSRDIIGAPCGAKTMPTLGSEVVRLTMVSKSRVGEKVITAINVLLFSQKGDIVSS